MKELSFEKMEEVNGGNVDCSTKAGFVTGLMTVGTGLWFSGVGAVAGTILIIGAGIYGLVAMDGCETQ